VLEPDQRLNVRVIFTPVLGRDTSYSQVIPIKINSNAKGKELVCSGFGDTPRIRFEPGAMECGPILPATPSQVGACSETWQHS
jgi:hydrocephalus-inducing protein